MVAVECSTFEHFFIVLTILMKIKEALNCICNANVIQFSIYLFRAKSASSTTIMI